VAIAGKLDAIGETFGKIADKLARRIERAIPNVKPGDQLAIRIKRDPSPAIASVNEKP
jgi:hypothetical protein